MTRPAAGFLPALLLVALTLPAHATEGPTRPDGIVFNHTIALADAGDIRLPLYFTRRGVYFAEVYFDRAQGASITAMKPVPVSFSIDVLRRGEVVFSRRFDETIAQDTRASTLFRLNTDRELPLKTPLDVVIRLADMQTPRAGEIESLTFQIRRKPNFRLGF